MSQDAICKLTPAAARLLLALLNAGPGESYDAVVERAGIHAYGTVARAKQSLCDLGYLLHDNAGQEYLNFQRREEDR